jgi:hypothetical protein
MIIGNVSIDPRRVLEAELTNIGTNPALQISLLYGDTIHVTDAFFPTIEAAMNALDKLDKNSYKTALVDAISDKDVGEEDDDFEFSDKIGFVH